MEVLNLLFRRILRFKLASVSQSQRRLEAVDQLPIRLLVSVAIISVVVLLIMSSSDSLRIFLAEQQIESQCRSIQASLSTLVGGGAVRDVDDRTAAEGAKRVQTITLPDSLLYLSFGGDPEASDNGVFSSDLVEEGAVIFYRVQGGSKHVIWLPKETCQFRKAAQMNSHWVVDGDGQSLVLHSAGTLTLVFERVQKNHKSYILIHNINDINR